LAVQGGQLQVLVLSCTPRDYEGLGGLEVILPRPQVTAGGIALAAPTAGDEEEDGDLADDGERPDGAERQVTSVAPVGDGDAAEFLAELTRRSGSSGNKALRDALGWDEERYNAVRDALVAEGLVLKGQGRGGSVRVR
ncbi:MAG: hypothetical protein KJT01_16555, partial [Gemmatimonadetes bacterium]|nr:hypothetical protein [Gemmatimonadota bacterium]